MNTKTYFSLFFFLFFVHAVEEYLTGFYLVDPIISTASDTLGISNQLIFLSIQVVWLKLLALSAISSKLSGWILAAFALVLLIELSHLVPAMMRLTYYPGLYTSLLIMAVGGFYVRDLVKTKQFIINNSWRVK